MIKKFFFSFVHLAFFKGEWMALKSAFFLNHYLIYFNINLMLIVCSYSLVYLFPFPLNSTSACKRKKQNSISKSYMQWKVLHLYMMNDTVKTHLRRRNWHRDNTKVREGDGQVRGEGTEGKDETITISNIISFGNDRESSWCIKECRL